MVLDRSPAGSDGCSPSQEQPPVPARTEDARWLRHASGNPAESVVATRWRYEERERARSVN
ncbi:hypothetical protein ACQP25_02610 [Microtetraspora malaysiensis]|uniref:hypothetical protein n=1 Tax=Microtetraspora malaysiensis TaxID=161358 RepID=UPI003D9193ED